MKAEDLHHFGIDLASGTCAKPWVFASEMLGRVSRTFALNIKVLPAFRLRRPVLLAYLFCRMADTIEDCPSMGADEKGRLLAIFARIFVQDPEQGLRNAVAFSQALPSGWKKSDDNNEFLCAHCVWTVALYFYLPVKVQQPIAACVREMCEGMARFAQRQESQQGQWLTIDNEADLDQYCYYVAGIVGNMLCDLFYTQSPLISEERYRQMKKLAVSFGLALQVVNITKDVAEDREREVCFIPQEWQRQEGFNHPSDLFHPNASRSARSRVMMHMVHKAWRHLQDSMEFTLLLPALEPRIRLFCLWPLLMAAETLVVVGDGNALFEPKAKVKITRDAVKRILRQTTIFCWNSRWLRSDFLSSRHHRQISGIAPVALLPNRSTRRISIFPLVIKINTPWTHFAVGFTGLLSDQATKIWAVSRFAEADGTPRHETLPVIGDLLRFQLDYNLGAAFSSRPQDILPFLHPTIFFGILTVLAIVGLVYFYRSLPKADAWSRFGVAMILGGALGNLSDRFRIGKVVDFISADFPDFIMQRWPTFNIADSLVLIGVGCVVLGPVILKRKAAHHVAV